MARRRDEGFSLIEALVALAVLSVSAISLLLASEGHIRRITGLESRASAQIVAENALAEIELGLGQRPETVELLGQTFEVDATRSETGDPDLERIDVTVADIANRVVYRGFVGFVAKDAVQ